MTRARPLVRRLPALAAAAVVVWLRLLPLSLPGVADPAALTFRGADGREHVYLGDYDSYLFVRHARHALRTGTPCDAWVGHECRDTLANAPVGRRSRYHGSIHVWAIATLHRLLERLVPGFPITSTAFLVPVVAGVLAAFVAYAIGLRLAGPLAGLAAAIVIGANPLFLFRSEGADNDVWNVLLPLCLVWAAGEALAARSAWRAAGWMAAAAAFVGLHALTWSGWVLTYAVVLAAVLARLALLALRLVRARGEAPRRAARDDWLRTATALAVFFVAAGLFVWLAGAEDGYLAVPHALTEAVGLAAPPVAPADPTDLWPSTFETVGELTSADLRGIAGVLSGSAHLFVGWIGLLLCLLPERRWRWWHAALLGAGLLLYPWLLADPLAWGRGTLVVALALPVVVGGVLAALEPRDDPAAGGALIAAVWFLATLYLAFSGQRYVMLLVPAFGLVFGVALGRVHRLVVALTQRVAPRAARVVGPLAFAVLALALWPPIEIGRAAIVRYRPRMNDAWWDTLGAIRDQSPPDAIVLTWWDFGHWTTFLAERPVLADGASLRTHVPHWMARALLAPSEAETLGLLRMLACGSDAAGEPEEARGADAKLRAAGLSAVEAHDELVALASLDRAAAAARLRARGLEEAQVDDVLASTHCTPPPSYLVLTNAMRGLSGWRFLGTWDMRRAYAARVARDLPEAEAVADMQARLGMSADDARRLWQAARAVDPAKLDEFIGPRLGYLTPEWVACTDVAGMWHCPVGVAAGNGMTLEAVRIVPSAPAQSRLVLRRPPAGGEQAATPGMLLLAGAQGVAELTFQGANFPVLGVLVDLPNRRVLLGRPTVLRSTFTQLLYLDGRYARRLEKVGERLGFGGERVVTWRVTAGEGAASSVEQP